MINDLKEISILNIKDTEFDEENEGIILVKTFGRGKIGLGISKKEGADAEIWLDTDDAYKLIDSLKIAIKEVLEIN